MQSQNSELENYIVYTEEKTNYSNLSFKMPLLLSCQISATPLVMPDFRCIKIVIYSQSCPCGHLYLRNNSTVFEELLVSIVDLTVANAVLLAMRSGASKTDICDRQIHN